MKHLIVGLGFEISDIQHVQNTSHVLENNNANNAVSTLIKVIKLIVPITDNLRKLHIVVF